MKVPPKPLTYNKDRTLTRRTVKGAAGGMKGVDYEDENRLAPHQQKATVGVGSNRDSPAITARVGHAVQAQQKESIDRGHGTSGAPKDEDEMVLDDEDAATRDLKARQRKHFVARDRLTVDKDAPKGPSKKKKRFEEEEEEDRPPEPEEIDLELLAERIAAAGDRSDQREQFLDHRDQPTVGDPDLVDPDQIQAALGSPVAYAKHAMILTEAFRFATGAYRQEALQYLAALYVSLRDRSFGRLALKEFGPATGIVDIYPLEIVEYILEHHPTFMAKAGFGRLFRVQDKRPKRLRLQVGHSRSLSYPGSVKIRGFAVKGGAAPGYRFEPVGDDHYELTINGPGQFVLLISGLTRTGHTIIDRLHVEVVGRVSSRPKQAKAGSDVLSPTYPTRDAKKVKRWPTPVPPKENYRDFLHEEEERPEETDSNLMSSGEIIRHQQLDALHGPKGEEADEEEPVLGTCGFEDLEPEPIEVEKLSHAERTLLKLAVATGTDDEDFVTQSEVPEPDELELEEPEEPPPEEAKEESGCFLLEETSEICESYQEEAQIESYQMSGALEETAAQVEAVPCPETSGSFEREVEASGSFVLEETAANIEASGSFVLEETAANIETSGSFVLEETAANIETSGSFVRPDDDRPAMVETDIVSAYTDSDTDPEADDELEEALERVKEDVWTEQPVVEATVTEKAYDDPDDAE